MALEIASPNPAALSHLTFLSHRKYVLEILEKAHMVNFNSSRTPVDTESISDPTLYLSLVGSLQYLTFTRPNISYVVHQVCLYMHDPQEPHFLALKRILRADAEYRGVANAVAETCWLRNLLFVVGQVRVLHVPSRYQFADIFTKELPSTLLEEFSSSLSVHYPSALTAREC
ncbi:ribonuclease H-like domain-containing protein [Tanacetum coccineum]